MGSQRGRGRIAGNPAVRIVVGLAAIIAAGVIGAAAHQIMGGGSLARLIAACIAAGLGLAAYSLLIVGRLEQRRPTELRAAWALPGLGLGMLLAAAAMGAILAVIGVLGDLRFDRGVGLGPALAAALAIGIGPGVLEELALRGLLFRIGEQYLGSWLMLAASALFFGFGHAANEGATLQSVLAIAATGGVVLALIYMVTRTLWAPIGLHAGWNALQSVLGLPVSGAPQEGASSAALDGPVWLTGGAFGIEASAVTVVVWAAGSAALAVLAIRRGRVVPPRWAPASAPESFQRPESSELS